MTLDELRKVLQLTNAMRSALNREVNDLAVRPDYAGTMLCMIIDLEVQALEIAGTRPTPQIDSKP